MYYLKFNKNFTLLYLNKSGIIDYMQRKRKQTIKKLFRNLRIVKEEK